jgi:hypothetical protein
MLRLNRSQRKLLGDKVGDTAHYAVAALVFGQPVSGLRFSRIDALFGVALWLALLLLGLLLRKGRP